MALANLYYGACSKQFGKSGNIGLSCRFFISYFFIYLFFFIFFFFFFLGGEGGLEEDGFNRDAYT